MGELHPENLRPVRTTEEARERGKVGGVASGIARREKRIIQDALIKRLGAKDLDEIVDNLIKRAKNNDRSVEVLRDSIGEKPVSRNETDITSDGESIKGIEVRVKNFKKCTKE